MWAVTNADAVDVDIWLLPITLTRRQELTHWVLLHDIKSYRKMFQKLLMERADHFIRQKRAVSSKQYKGLTWISHSRMLPLVICLLSNTVQ